MKTSRLLTVCILRSTQLANSIERNSLPCSSRRTTTSPGWSAFRISSPSFSFCCSKLRLFVFFNMPSIEARRNALGRITSYRLIVSEGLDYTGKQIKRRTLWVPPKHDMSETQMEREAWAAAYHFEQQIKQGYDIDPSPSMPSM